MSGCPGGPALGNEFLTGMNCYGLVCPSCEALVPVSFVYAEANVVPPHGTASTSTKPLAKSPVYPNLDNEHFAPWAREMFDLLWEVAPTSHDEPEVLNDSPEANSLGARVENLLFQRMSLVKGSR